MDLTPGNSPPFPFDNLPEELGVQIIKYYVTSEMEIFLPSKEFIKFIDLNRLLPLTLVSTDWRRRIVDAPSLWTDIVLDEYTEDLAMKVELCLRFSKAAHLSLHFRWAWLSWPVVAERIISQRTRIHTIAMHSTYYGPVFARGIQAILQQLEPLTSLTQVICPDLPPKNTEMAHFIERRPSIVNLRGFPLSVSTLLHDSRQWTHFFSDEVPYLIVPPLQRISSLKSVVIDPKSTLDFRTPVLTVRPLRWESLIYSTETTFPIFLLDRLRSHLIHLEFGIDTSRLLDILSVLEDCTSLKVVKLTLSLDYRQSEPSTPNSGLASGSTLSSAGSAVQLPVANPPDLVGSVTPQLSTTIELQNLELMGTETTGSNEQIPPKDRPKPRSGNNVKSLTISWVGGLGILDQSTLLSSMRNIQKAMPSVNKLTLTNVSLHDASFLPLSLWNLLEHLDFQPPRVKNLERVHWTLPSTLKRFKANVTYQSLSHLRSATVERLEITNWNSQLVPLTDPYDISQWPNLHSLKVYGFIQVSYKSPLLWLREVSLKNDDDKQNPANKLYQQLAIDSSGIPALESLEHIGKVEWDILLIFLERRNISNSATVSPMKRLIIQRPNHTLEKALRRLLKRKSGKLPRYYDISWEGNAEILYDLSIPGCLNCHDCLRYCNQRVERRINTPDLAHLSYPDNEDEILATWESRRVTWHGLTKPTRPGYCRVWELVTITDQSIDDPTYERGNE